MQRARAGTARRTALCFVSFPDRRKGRRLAALPRGRSPDFPLDAKGAALSSRHPGTLRTPFASTCDAPKCTPSMFFDATVRFRDLLPLAHRGCGHDVRAARRRLRLHAVDPAFEAGCRDAPRARDRRGAAPCADALVEVLLGRWATLIGAGRHRPHSRRRAEARAAASLRESTLYGARTRLRSRDDAAALSRARRRELVRK